MTNVLTLNDALVPPAVEVRSRVLEIIMLIDCSTSMRGKRIAAANQAMRESINELKTEAAQHPDIEYRMRCIAFASEACWHIGPDPINLAQLAWTDLKAKGWTETGAAVDMLAQSIRMENMPKRGLPPVMALVSDGGNTDGKAYDKAIDRLNTEIWGNKAIRLSIGIGDKFNRQQLEKFTNHPEVGVLEAKNAVDLANYIRYATVNASIASSQTATTPGPLLNNVALPAPPAVTDASNVNLQVF